MNISIPWAYGSGASNYSLEEKEERVKSIVDRIIMLGGSSGGS